MWCKYCWLLLEFCTLDKSTLGIVYLIFKSKGGTTINSRKDLPFSVPFFFSLLYKMFILPIQCHILVRVVSFRFVSLTFIFVEHETHILYTCTRVPLPIFSFFYAVVGAAASFALMPRYNCIYQFLSFFYSNFWLCCFFSHSFFSHCVSDWHNVCERNVSVVFFFSCTFISFKYSSIFGKDFCPLQFGSEKKGSKIFPLHAILKTDVLDSANIDEKKMRTSGELDVLFGRHPRHVFRSKSFGWQR